MKSSGRDGHTRDKVGFSVINTVIMENNNVSCLHNVFFFFVFLFFLFV